MTIRLTASRLRENIFQILDEILRTGQPVEIERRGSILRIVPERKSAPNKLDALEEHPGAFSGDPEDIAHLDWSGEWKP
jgi:hypothetical protein